MVSRERTLIDQIEQEALDQSASLADALRKCVVLGGRAGSEQLRDWATRELEGYYSSDGEAVELPGYRVIAGQIQIDGATAQGLVSQQPIPPSWLPDFVRETVSEQFELREGVGAIEALVSAAEARGESVKVSLPMGNDIARLMNQEHGNPSQQILSVYWALATPTVRGVLDQVRTALAKLVAELRATMPPGQDVPSGAAADQAVNVLVTGKRSKTTVTVAQSAGDHAPNAITSGRQSEDDSVFWTTSRRIGAAVVGLAGIAGAVFGAIQAF